MISGQTSLRHRAVRGNLYRNDQRYVARIGTDYTIGGVTETIIEVYEVETQSGSYFTASGKVSHMIAVDHGLPDDVLLALLTKETSGGSSTRKIRLSTLSGTTQWAHQIGNSGLALDFGAFAMAAGDVTGDGVSDVVYAFSPVLGLSPDSLGVIDGKTGGRAWTVATGDVAFNRAYVRLVDIENDGALEVITNTRVSGSSPEDRIQCYSSTGSLIWEVAVGDASDTPPPTFFVPADIDHDGVKEIIFARGTRLGVITISGSSATIDDEVNLAAGNVFFSTPLAMDIDGDDRLEIVVLCRVKNHYLNAYSLELQIYDDDLSPVTPTYAYPWTTASGAPDGLPREASARDIDGDGVIEVGFSTPGGLYHAVRVGTTVGRADWTSVYGNSLGTGLYEQVLGGTYAEPVAINGRARVLSDATFTEGLTITAPAEVQVGALDSLVVEDFLAIRGSPDDSVRVRVDGLETPGSRWGAVVYRNASTRGDVRHAVLMNALGGFAHDSPLKVTGSRLTDLADVGVVSRDTLWFEGGAIEGCGGSGIDAREGAVVLLSASTIQDCSQFGVVIADESSLDASETSFHGNAIAVYLARGSGSWVKGALRDCTFSNGAHGVWVADSGDSLVTIEDCTIETGTTGMYLEAAGVVVDGATVRGAQLGINAHTRTTLTLTGSVIENASLYGLIAFDEATVDVSGTSFDGNDTGVGLSTSGGAWVKGRVRNSTFSDNGDGIWVGDTGDSLVVIHNCEIDNSTTNGVFVEDAGVVTIRYSTITNGTSGVYAYESAPKIGPLNAIQYNTVGIACEQNATAVVESCLVTENSYGVNVRTGSNPDLGHASGGSSTGYNIFIPTTTYYVYNKTSNTVSGEVNYWPASPPEICLPLATKIYGPVDTDPALCSPPALFLVISERILDEEDPGESVPVRFELAQNFPNPFNPATTIAFSVPPPGARVEITLYDVTGRRVAELVNGHQSPGRYRVSWDGRNRRGEPVASGVYFLRMRAGTFVETRKLHLIR